ncbi:MAG: hypothetical protein ACRD93_04775 [Nitrososphaeraceae archaeon]
MARAVEEQIPKVYRIGIDLNMISELLEMFSGDNELKKRLDLNTLKELYKPKNFLKRLNDLRPDYGDPEGWYEKLDFVREYRIEVDSVESAIGINKFWQYMKTKLAERFPNRDYNRAVEVNDFEYPTLFHDFHRLLKERLISILEDDVEETKNDLETYNGIINDVERKESEIRFNFTEIVDDDESLNIVRSKLQELIDELKGSE